MNINQFMKQLRTLLTTSRRKNSCLLIFWIGLTFFLPLSLLYLYNLADNSITIFGIELRKISPRESTIKVEDFKPIIKNQILNISGFDTTQFMGASKNFKIDSLFYNAVSQNMKVTKFTSLLGNNQKMNLSGSDTIGQRVLIIGDSQCGGMTYQLNDYCQENGHNILASLVWYSATIFNLAYADTINNIIKKYAPTYIFIVVGLNEMYAKDLEKRKKAAGILANKISGIPYTWIGPANYQEDFGINQVFIESAEPGTFYMTKQLDLPRGQDNRHPSKEGYRIWMDSLAVWLQKDAKYKIRMNPPEIRNRLFHNKIITLHAAKYRGY